MFKKAKKAMSFLGLVEDDYSDFEQETAAQPVAKAQKETREQAAAPAPAPLRKLTPVPAIPQGGVNEIFTVHPTTYADAQVIAETFRDDVPVILDLSGMVDAEARRIIDFCSGLVMGLNGNIERVTGKVFVLRPFNVAATSEAEETYEETAEQPRLFATGS